MSDFQVLPIDEGQLSPTLHSHLLELLRRVLRLLPVHVEDQVVGGRDPHVQRLGGDNQRARRGRSYPRPPRSRQTRRARRSHRR